MVNNSKLKKIAEELIGMSLSKFSSSQLKLKNHSKNNRLYYFIANDNKEYALKSYSKDKLHETKRLDVEFESLNYLFNYGKFNIPRPIARNNKENCGIYSWINGEKVNNICEKDVHQVVNFISNLFEVSRKKESYNLPNAKEACFSADVMVRQIFSRYNLLNKVSPFYNDLAEFLRDDFEPLLTPLVNITKKKYKYLNLNFNTEIPHEYKILSPSDFGFHNSIRNLNGELYFIDFEYFGWDDPAKLVGDFLLHPAIEDINFKLNEWKLFYKFIKKIFDFDNEFHSRLLLNLPLLSMRWSLILLNEFLPNNWERRVFSGEKKSRATVLKNQLKKARKYTRLVRWSINSDEKNFLSENYIDNFYLKSFN
ncbi:MAG: hypothetical protein CMM49_06810 [Rhodospirillaceae bacterium]|nr:hypothetical protein [Rhodospirillaceae bacterium]|tara:strand:+ start:25819 stop:26919 length:1101 start_codon:yes stop_codon:yes gene_type:complete